MREAAAELVSAAFIRPMLAEARRDPFKSDLFHGGRGEEIFGQQLDGILADRITTAANFPLTDAIVQHFVPQSTAPTRPEVDTLA